MLQVRASAAVPVGGERDGGEPTRLVEIKPDENGFFGDDALMGSVKIKFDRFDHQLARLTFYFTKGADKFDVIQDENPASSFVLLALREASGKLHNQGELPADFDKYLTFTGFSLPVGQEAKLSVVIKPSKEEVDRGIYETKKVSGLILSYSVD